MITRLADMEGDGLAVFDGAKDFVSRLDCPECVASDDEGLIEAISYIFALPGFECWLVEDGGGVVGGIGLLFSPPLWNRRVMGMSELFIWAAPDALNTVFLRLMKQARRRKREMNATYQELFILTSSPPGIEKVYARMGLRKTQETWVGVG